MEPKYLLSRFRSYGRRNGALPNAQFYMHDSEYTSENKFQNLALDALNSPPLWSLCVKLYEQYYGFITD
jgi:hypothetical protein